MAAEADGSATAEGPPRAEPVVTRAALVAGRGADVPFLVREVEHAHTDGAVIGPDRTAYTVSAEAPGRAAVLLEPGSTSSSRVPAATNLGGWLAPVDTAGHDHL